MKIQVIGTGCKTCHQLYELTKKAVDELNLKTQVEYIADVAKLLELGAMQSPILVVNNKIVMTGFTPDIKKIKEAIQKK